MRIVGLRVSSRIDLLCFVLVAISSLSSLHCTSSFSFSYSAHLHTSSPCFSFQRIISILMDVYFYLHGTGGSHHVEGVGES